MRKPKLKKFRRKHKKLERVLGKVTRKRGRNIAKGIKKAIG